MSPRTPEQNEEIRQARISQILDAAVTVYLENGVNGTEIGDIAKQAGMARGLIYYYYKDKDELLQGLFTHAMYQAESFIRGLLVKTLPPRERLRNFAVAYMRRAVFNRRMYTFYCNVAMDIPCVFGSRSDEAMKRYQMSVEAPITHTIQEGIEQRVFRSGDPVLHTHVFWGGMMGAVRRFIAQPETEHKDEVFFEVVNLLFLGIQNQE